MESTQMSTERLYSELRAMAENVKCSIVVRPVANQAKEFMAESWKHHFQGAQECIQPAAHKTVGYMQENLDALIGRECRVEVQRQAAHARVVSVIREELAMKAPTTFQEQQDLDAAALKALLPLCEQACHVLRHLWRGVRGYWPSWEIRQEAKGRVFPRLKRMGWAVLGNGHYAFALYHRSQPEYVLKVSGPAGFGRGLVYDRMVSGHRDAPILDPWPVFARHCMAHPHKHLPETLHFQQVSQSFAWAVMPKYKPYPDVPGDSEDFRLRVEAVIHGEIPGGADEAWIWPLRQMADALNYRADLHSENVMWSDRAQAWVVSDPFSDGDR